MKDRPLLLIDVDGVISLFGAGQTGPSDVLPALVDGMPHLLSRRAGAHLRRLARTFECVWCTGWEERAPEQLPALLDLPRGWPHITFRDRPEYSAHWKLSGIDAAAGAHRALAWIDDSHDETCHAWAAARPGPTLLVGTRPEVGLEDAHVARLEAWAKAPRTARGAF
jgi:hypothetical protein